MTFQKRPRIGARLTAIIQSNEASRATGRVIAVGLSSGRTCCLRGRVVEACQSSCSTRRFVWREVTVRTMDEAADFARK
jgi:hypothetical protein